MKVFVYMIVTFSLTNASPLRNRLNEDGDEISRDDMAGKSFDTEEMYNAFLDQRDSSESELPHDHLKHKLVFWCT